MIIKSEEKKENSIIELIVEVSAEEFDSAMGEAYRKNRNSISVPGFRKGKAPRKIVERMYGASIFHSDAMEILLPSVLEYVNSNTDAKTVGNPQVTDVDIKDDGGGADIIIELAEYPDIKLGDYKGLSAYKPSVEVADSEIDSEIEGVRKRNARFESVERPAISGDTALIDYEGFVDGEQFEGGTGNDQELILGSNQFIPGFEEKMLGMKPGDERDLELVFPDEYTPELAGKPVMFKVKLKELRESILPELDDEFAMDVSEFDTLDEYKAGIRDRISKVRQAEADAAFENALIDQIVKSMEADVPEVMVEEQLDAGMQTFARQISAYGMDPMKYLQMTGATPESLRDNMRATSEKQVRGTLALEKIAELEGLEVSEEEIEDAYKEASENFGFEIEKVKENVPEEAIKREALLKKAAKIVTDSATALDKEPEIEDLDQESKEPPKKAAAKKTASKKTSVDAETDANPDASTTENDAEKDSADAAAKPEKKPAAKKPSTKKTKPDSE